MKSVYVVCATGVATSTMLRLKIENYLRDRGIDAEVKQFRVTELSPSRTQADAIVSTAQMPDEYQEIAPVIDGVPLITGVGEKETLEALYNVLKED